MCAVAPWPGRPPPALCKELLSGVQGRQCRGLRPTGCAHCLGACPVPRSPVQRLQSEVPGVVRAVARQLRMRSIKSRVGAFQV